MIALDCKTLLNYFVLSKRDQTASRISRFSLDVFSFICTDSCMQRNVRLIKYILMNNKRMGEEVAVSP